ncbi:MAG: hypothetical protein ACFFD4_08360 [Candidatus Odinarchaeota archaeon]
MSVVELTIWNSVAIGFFGFFFGGFETVTNFLYAVTDNLEIPRKQHGAELPVNASDQDVKMKVYQMLILGIILLTVSTLSLLTDPRLFIIGGLAILSSALLDAKKFRKWNMLIVWSVITALVIVFSLIPI